MVDFISQFMASRRAEDKARRKRQTEKLDLLSDPAKMDKLVASFVREVSPSARKGSNKIAGFTERAESVIPSSHPFAKFGQEMKAGLRDALVNPEYEGVSAKELALGTAQRLIAMPGSSGKARISEAHLHKMRADTAMSNFFGVFGEDESVKAAPGYEGFKESMLNAEIGETFNPLKSAVGGAAIGAGFEVARRGAVAGLAKLGVKRAATWAATAALTPIAPAVATAAAVAVPAFLAYDAISSMIDRTAYGKAWEGTIRKELVELGVGGVLPGVLAAKGARLAFAKAAEKNILSAQARQKLTAFPTAKNAIEAGDMKRAANEAEDVLSGIVGKSVEGDKYRDLVHGALLEVKGPGGRTFGERQFPEGVYGTSSQRAGLLAAKLKEHGLSDRKIANVLKNRKEWMLGEAEASVELGIEDLAAGTNRFNTLVGNLQRDIEVARQALPSEVQTVGSSIRRGLIEKKSREMMKDLSAIPPGMIHPGTPKEVMKQLTDEGFEVAVLRAKKKGINRAIKEVGAEEVTVAKVNKDENRFFKILENKIKKGEKVFKTDMQRALLEYAGQYVPLREIHGDATSNLLRKAALQISKTTGIELNQKTILKKMTTDIYDIGGLEGGLARKLAGTDILEGSAEYGLGKLPGPRWSRNLSLEEVHATLLYKELHHIKGNVTALEKQMLDQADYLITKRGMTPEQAIKHHSVKDLIAAQARGEEAYASTVKKIEEVLAVKEPHFAKVEREQPWLDDFLARTQKGDITPAQMIEELQNFKVAKFSTSIKFPDAPFPTKKMLTSLKKFYGQEARDVYDASIKAGVPKVTAYKNAIESTPKGLKAFERAQRKADKKAQGAAIVSSLDNSLTATKGGRAMTADEMKKLADDILNNADDAVKDGTESMFTNVDVDKLDPSKILGAILIGAASIPLASIFSPDSAEAADYLKLGTTVSRATAGMIKNGRGAISESQLAREMYDAGVVVPIVQPGQKTLPRAQEAFSLSANTKQLVKEGAIDKKAGFLGFSVMSPHAQARLIFSNGRNAITELGMRQNDMGVNINNAYGTFANIVKDVPGFKPAGDMVQKVMAPLAEKFSGNVVAFRTIDLKLARMRDRYEKLAGAKKVAPKHAAKVQDRKDKIAAEIQILEDVHSGLKVKFNEFEAAWTQQVRGLAVNNPSVRLSLAAEDTADYKVYPWLKGMLNKEEELAVGHIKGMMETYKARMLSVGADVIEGPYMHHGWHPKWDAAKAETILERNGANIKSLAPFTKFYSRNIHSKQMVPDIAYNIKRYVADTERRLQWSKFWGKKKPVEKVVDGKKTVQWVKNPDGWWAHMHSKVVKRNETLSKFWEQVNKSSQMTPNTTANEWANRYQALETFMLLGFSPSTAFKHAFKNIGTWGMIGIGPAAKHIKSAVGVAFRNSTNYGVIHSALGKLGIKGKVKKKTMDDFVKAVTHQHGLTNAMLDMEIAPVGVGGGFLKRFDRKLQKFNEVGSVLIQAVESYDRAHTALATMSMAAKKGMTAKQAAYSMHHTIIINNFLGNALNPQWARNPKLRAIFLFQNTASKIMERRVVNAIKANRSAKGFFGIIRKQELKKTLEQIKDTQRAMKEGGDLLKQNLWADFRKTGQSKNVFDTSHIRQFVREAFYMGATIGGLGSMLDSNFWPHTFHLPFFKEKGHGGGDATVAFSPFASSLYSSLHHFQQSNAYGSEVEYDISDFIDDWLGTRGAIPLTFQKAIRLSENDIPDIYKNSKMKYLFAVPAKRQ